MKPEAVNSAQAYTVKSTPLPSVKGMVAEMTAEGKTPRQCFEAEMKALARMLVSCPQPRQTGSRKGAYLIKRDKT